MDDDVRIHVELSASGEPAPPDAGGRGAGGAASSNRVVQGGSRWRQAAVVVVLAGLVAAGLALAAGGGTAPDGGDEDAEPGQPRPARVVWVEATRRLGQARTFAYRGSVHARRSSAVRPGAWLAEDVTVEGAVLLPHSITREVAIDGEGRAVETVTSGSTAWSRTAPSAARLPDGSWEVVREPATTPDGWSEVAAPRLGVALVADVLRAARDRRHDPPEGAGPRTLRATVPTDDRRQPHVELFSGAEVSITLDEAGDIARVVVRAGPADAPRFVIELDIERLGEAGLVTPAHVGEPARSTVGTDVGPAGAEALELSRVPAGWALTGARQRSGRTAARSGQPQVVACPGLELEYRDLRAVSEGWMTVSVGSESCSGPTRADEVGAPFRAGSFTGRVEEGFPTTAGRLSDGTTTVFFETDLSPADAAVVLASLAPLDATRDPAPLAGLPSP